MKRLLICFLVFLLCCIVSCEKGEVAEKDVEIDVPEITEPEKDFTIIKVEKEGITTELTFEIPFELFGVIYTEEKLSSPEDFTFGDYGLFVGMATGTYSAEQIPMYSYGLITPNTKNIDDAMSLYNDFNDSHQIKPPSFAEEIDALEDFKFYRDFAEKSRVIYISEEVDTLGIAHAVDGGSFIYQNSKDFFTRKWNSEYHLLDTETNKVTSYSKDGVGAWILNNYGFDEAPSDRSYNYTANGQFFVEKNPSYYIKDKTPVSYTLYKTEDRFVKTNEETLKLTVSSSVYWDIADYDGEKYMLLLAKERELYALFLYDLEENKLEYLQNNACHATLSPDGKYIAYTSPIESEWTHLFGDMKVGFYIKNLETNETVFYDCEDKLRMYIQFIAGWINTNRLK